VRLFPRRNQRISLNRKPPRERLKGWEGFSFIEVLVALAIIAGAVTVVIGGLRKQVRTTRVLQVHSEARMILQQVADRFQYGEGAPTDSTVTGEFQEYRIRFREVGEDGDQPIDLPEGEAPPATFELPPETAGEQERLEKYVISVSWIEDEAPNDLRVEAWRLPPPVEEEAPGFPE